MTQAKTEAALPTPYAEKAPLHCSFCLKSQHEVAKLIAGPGFIFICDECVALCDAIVAGRAGEDRRGQVQARRPSPRRPCWRG